MSYQIRLNESLGESIRRVACEQIDAAIEASRSEQNGKGSPVHATRRHLKKARAALRLLAPEIGPHRFKREDRRLRNVGRLISEIRDAEVRLETIKQLGEGSNFPLSDGFEEARQLLSFELDSFLAAFAGWQDEAADKLRRARAGVMHWHLRKLTSKKVCSALRESYRAGRDALKCARKGQRQKQFHELRKRAKELRYQLRILRPLQHGMFCEMSDELKTLGDFLGHAHDLCFVAERMQSIAADGARAKGKRGFEKLIGSREEDLLRAALALGERFYCVKPKQFVRCTADLLCDRVVAKGREAYVLHAVA